MKKTILVLVIATAFTMPVIAQSSFGIKGGVNFSNLAVDKDHIDENKYLTGFTAGIINRINFGSAIGFQSELLYSRKGAKYNISSATVKANLVYLEIPLTLQVRLLGSPVSVYGGGYAAYLINAKYEYDFNNNDPSVTFDDKDAFKKFDFGVLGGVNVNIGRILIDGRFNYGLTNVEDENRVIGTHNFIANDTKNFGFQLTVAIMLR